MNRAPGMFKATAAGQLQLDKLMSAPAVRVVYKAYGCPERWIQGDEARLFLRQRFHVLGYIRGDGDSIIRTVDRAFAVVLDDTGKHG